MKKPIEGGKPFVVVDLDGTLSDPQDRLHWIRRNKPDWKRFHEECGNDAIHPWCQLLVRALLDQGIIVVLLSARPAACLEATETWLRMHGFSDYLEAERLRPRLLSQGDGTPDVELKRAWLNKHPDHRASIVFAVEDRGRVVDMWREEGVVCLQAAAWQELSKAGLQ